MERQIGRIKEFGAQKVYAFDEHGEFGVQADYRFSSEEGRGLITSRAEQLGLQEVRGGAEKIGLVFAVIGIGGALITLVVLLICWQTGLFG